MQPIAVHQGLKFVERRVKRGAAASATDFIATVRQMGFAGGACGTWAGVGRNRKYRFQRNDYARHDVLPIEARRRVSSFWYSEVVDRFKLTEKQKELYDAGVAYGWKDVFCVPIHGPGSLQGLGPRRCSMRWRIEAGE